MWRPSIPIPPRVRDGASLARSHTEHAIRSVIGFLVSRLLSTLPTRERLRAHAILTWRRFAGFSAAFFLAILPAFIWLLLDEFSIIPSTGDLSSRANLVIAFALIATIVLVIALIAVYFLRTLYWAKNTTKVLESVHSTARE